MILIFHQSVTYWLKRNYPYLIYSISLLILLLSFYLFRTSSMKFLRDNKYDRESKKRDSDTLKILQYLTYIYLQDYLQNDNVLFFETRIILYKRILNFIHIIFKKNYINTWAEYLIYIKYRCLWKCVRICFQIMYCSVTRTMLNETRGSNINNTVVGTTFVDCKIVISRLFQQCSQLFSTGKCFWISRKNYIAF